MKSGKVRESAASLAWCSALLSPTPCSGWHVVNTFTMAGPGNWYAASAGPAEAREAAQAKIIAMYERGLVLARTQTRPADPLAPSWGEPELLMNLAWSHLNKVTPDPGLAGKYAREALALVPDWHYLRNILLPQIEAARARQP